MISIGRWFRNEGTGVLFGLVIYCNDGMIMDPGVDPGCLGWIGWESEWGYQEGEDVREGCNWVEGHVPVGGRITNGECT